MELTLFRHTWGLETPLPHLIANLAHIGYHGIHAKVSEIADEHTRDLMKQHQFRFVATIATSGSTVEEHLRSFRAAVEEAVPYAPVLINCQAGSDRFSLEESIAFFRAAVEIEKEFGIPVAHETHRRRPFFTPWATRAILEAVPELQICADFSHWVCVTESLLAGEEETLRLAAGRTLLIHARVAYEQGPQVPDPRAPEFQEYLKVHEAWWDLIWDAQKARGFAESILVPEFGPPPYLQTFPYTREPLANLWDVCNWQALRQKERFQRRYGKPKPAAPAF